MKSKTHISKMQAIPEERESGGSFNSPSQKGKVLLVDSEPDRQARIAILKQYGFRVYPALSIEQARSRCRSGAYDVIVLNADSGQTMAFELYDQIHERDPKQHVLVMTAKELPGSGSEHMVSSVPERLLERVELLLASGRNREPLIA